ncbi:MAG: hydroxymethylbilane synthase [Syntrophobacteraceae bacterium]
MTERPLRIGTRGSLLALTQSGLIKRALEELWPGLQVELKIIKTTGDRIQDVPLAKVGGKGLFVKEIEDALLAEEVDLAVHSMKDVPAELPPGLEIGVVPEREDPRDVLITNRGKGLGDLPEGAVVGSSSLRRAAQVKRLRPDLRVEMLRGNLDTRLKKLENGQYDAIILAAAGLHRMGWRDRITAYFDPSEFVPAIGQGALGLELRTNDETTRRLAGPLHHADTAVAVEAERAFLQTLEGGCQVPIGGHATVSPDEVTFSGLVASVDGRIIYSKTDVAPRSEAAALGRRIANELLDAGARRILQDVYNAC